ncbi:MAG: putative lipid II flippase FtsW [Parcubacteria group bacterium]|nr:putative lipid II flippase FtsW [Parcubacteria group bacterium]
MTARYTHKQAPRSALHIPLFAASGAILVFGLLMLFSASVAVGIERFGDPNFFIKRQLIALLLGLGAAYLAYRIDYRVWQRWSFVILLASVALLVLVLVPGIGIAGQGAQRWLNLGPFGFQPSELAKLTLILYLAAWLSERGRAGIRDFYTGLLPLTIVLGAIAFLILKQPDLGTLIIICAIAISMYFVGGADLKHLAGLLGAGAVALGAAIALAPYRLARFTAFLDPSADPQGAGYHITQALLAVGSGGIFGRGLTRSLQKYLYLPEVTGDSIFAVIAEELGFAGSMLVLALFLFFFWQCIRISRSAGDGFGKLAAFGVGTWIALQAFINIGAMLGVLPLTGLTLPLVSYGGSSLVVTLVAIGILLNISKMNRAS